jgi:very-short-patch-repair endonuclease
LTDEQTGPRPRRRDSSPDLREEAARQRRRITPSEHALWEALRDRRFRGLKFRRQHPLGPFIADLYCAECHLAIEIDGSVHDAPEARARDAERDEWLRARGVTVVHLPARLVLGQLGAALAAIGDALDNACDPLRRER